MISAETYGKSIVNALLNTGKNKTGTTVTFTATPYIALFTSMPTSATGSGCKEPTSDEYARVLLTNTGAYGKQMLATAESVTENGVEYASVKNQDLIVFPEAKSAGFGEIVGVGIFTREDAVTPYIWGALTQAVTIDQGEIPIFRIGDFVFRLA